MELKELQQTWLGRSGRHVDRGTEGEAGELEEIHERPYLYKTFLWNVEHSTYLVFYMFYLLIF